jgi:hypothetical protein
VDLTIAARDVLVGIQLRRPDVRSLLVSAVGCRGAQTVAAAVAEATRAIGRSVHHVHVEGADAQPKIETDVDDLRLNTFESFADVSLVHSEIARMTAGAFLVASTSDFLRVHESRVLAANVDGVILLARENVTRAADLRAADRQLLEVGATLLGSVYLERDLD